MIIVLSCIFMADEEKIGAPGGRQGSALTQPLSPPATAGLLGGMAAPTPAPGAWRGVVWRGVATAPGAGALHRAAWLTRAGRGWQDAPC